MESDFNNFHLSMQHGYVTVQQVSQVLEDTYKSVSALDRYTCTLWLLDIGQKYSCCVARYS